MNSCPSCHKELDIRPQHHGTLFTCSQCNAVFFVNWDGFPEIAEHEMPEVTSENEGSGFGGEVFSEGAEAGLESAEPSDIGFASEESDSSVMDAELEGELPSIDTPLGGHFEVATPESSDQSSSPLSANQFMAEVVDFANSDTPLEGFNYSIVVSGIDSTKQLELLEEVLLDPRLAINVSETLQSVSAGSLKIENLNAAKAFILIERFQHISFDVEWFQNV